MLSINNAFKIIGPHEYMAAIDLTDAFFSVPTFKKINQCLTDVIQF